MKIIFGKYNEEIMVDDDVYEWASKVKWYVYNKYVLDRKFRKLHRLILGLSDRNKHVDHISGDTLDNRRENLRICTRSQNNKNTSKRKSFLGRGISSIFKGVYWCNTRKKWVSRIYVDNKQIYMGFYDREEDAAIAYNRAAVKYHGEFAKLNEIRRHA